MENKRKKGNPPDSSDNNNDAKARPQTDGTKATSPDFEASGMAPLFKKMYHSAPIGIVVVDLSGTIKGCNTAFERIVGFREAELTGKNIADITDPSDMEKEIVLFKTMKEGKQHSFSMDKRYIDSKGATVHVHVTASLLEDDSGKSKFVLGFVEDVTSRKKTEVELRKNEEKFRTIFDTTPDFIFLIDDTGRILDSNPTLIHRLGMTLNQVRTANVKSFLTEDSAAAIDEALATLSQGKEIRGLLARTKPSERNGPVELEVNALPLRGSPTSLCVARDITLRKQAERALNESNLFFQSLIANLPIAVFGKDPEGCFVVWNRYAEKLFGMSAKNVIGKSDEDFFPPEQVEHFRRMDEEAMRKGEVINIEEETILTPHLGMRWLHTIKVPLYKENGDWLCLLGISEDITEKRLAEKRMHLLTASVERSVDGIAIAELDGTLLFVNQAWADMHGLGDPEKLIGRNFSLFHTEQQMRDDVFPFNETVMAKGLNTGEIGHVRQNGETFPALMSVALLKETPYTPEALVAVARDISYLKNTEEELRKHKEDLEGLVKERTAELTAANLELQLEISERKAVQEMLFKTQQESEFYLDLMFHDLTNFNQTALGFLSLLENKTEASLTQKKYIDYCKRQHARSENLISRVRAFSRLKNVNEKELHFIELNAAVSDAINMIKTLYPSNTPEISFAPAGEKCAFGTSLIDNVITSILENAIKHSVENKVKIGVTIEEAADPAGDMWLISITDDGPGVPNGMKERIFDRFVKIGKEKGMGLGLSLARAIVEKFGGRIWVENRSGGLPGSVFKVTLLRAK